MQIEVSVSEENGIISISGHGELDRQSVFDSIATISSHPAVKSGYDIILDFHQVTGSFSINDIYTLAHEHRKYKDINKKNRIALIVRKKDFGKANILAMLVRNFGIRIESFEETAAALRYFCTGASWQ